jgi:hypothetical protein
VRQVHKVAKYALRHTEVYLVKALKRLIIGVVHQGSKVLAEVIDLTCELFFEQTVSFIARFYAAKG